MKTIWILEDLQESHTWLGKALEAVFPGATLHRFFRLSEALQAAQTLAPPDLALVDLSLPDGDGVVLIQWFNTHAPKAVCVVASIYDDDIHLMPALRAGAQGFLLKDQSWQQIAQLLRGIAEGRPPLSPAIARRLLAYFRPTASDLVSERLTQRETEVLSLIAKGLTLAETARLLGISTHTVSGYTKEIYRKLNVSSRAEAALTARSIGLV
ncbi:MAG: response regulator transcription factor [Rhodoferax sp.]|nr:response regulator transcription factor [Rhodoferax sp.]